MTSNLDHLEALWRQAEIDSRDKRSRLKIIGSLPQTRLLKALYANAESLIVGCKAVEGVVEQQEQLRAAINEILDRLESGVEFEGEAWSTSRLRNEINALFDGDLPANDAPRQPTALSVVK